MDLLVFVRERSMNIWSRVPAFYDDVVRLLHASPIFGGLIIATGVVLGFVPIFLWQYIGHFIDACFASRGIGIMTIDLSHSAFLVGGLGVLLFAASAYFLQTKALSRSIATTIAIVALLTTHILTLFPIEKSFLIFLTILALGFHIAKHRAVVFVVNAVLVLLTISTISDILFMMTHRSMTVGNALEYCLTIFALAAVSMWMMHRSEVSRLVAN